MSVEECIITEIGLRYNNMIEKNPQSKKAIKSAVYSMLTLFDNCWVGEYTPPTMEILFKDKNIKKEYNWHDIFISNLNDEDNFEYIHI